MSTTPAPAPVKLPNLYQLQGHGLHVTYSRSSIVGKSQLTYQDAHQTLQFSDAQIRSVSTEIGELVTVTIVPSVDTGTTAFSLMLPGTNLQLANQAHIKTFGITTIHQFSAVLPFKQGQTEIYTHHELSGTASSVQF